MKHDAVGFVSGCWLRFGARAVSQGPGLFLSSPVAVCDIKVKSRIAFGSGFTKAAEHPTLPWVTPVGRSRLLAAAIGAAPPAEPGALGHGLGRTEVAARGQSIMVLPCSKDVAVPRQGHPGCLSALCF